MKKLFLPALLLLLLTAGAAEARSIKPSKAKTFVEAQLASPKSPLVAQLHTRSAGLDVSTITVKDCKTKRKGKKPQVDCKLFFPLTGPGSKINCYFRNSVKYRKKGSKDLVAKLENDRVTCK